MLSIVTKVLFRWFGLVNKLPKHALPKSLFGRFLLIIIVPNIIMQLVAVYVFFDRHWSSVSYYMSESLVGDVLLSTRLLSEDDEGKRAHDIALINRALNFKVELLPETFAHTSKEKVPEELRYLQNRLLERLPYPFALQYTDAKDILLTIFMDEQPMRITLPRKRLINPSTDIFVTWVIGTSVLLLVVAILFMRTQVRSIRKLAMVAEQFGRGQDIENFKPSGAAEVRRAGYAFIQMKERIKRQVEQRMEMLSGVSHDLKTPLTRVKLQLAMMEPTEDVNALQQDAVEMEKMLNEYLDFVRGKERGPAGEINVSDLLRSIVAGYRHHHDLIDLNTPRGMQTVGNGNALRRAVTNLIDNSLRYGTHVWISGDISVHELHIIIDDNGPGIPVNKRDVVFKPFYRLDRARNLDSGGTGLGLSIAKDVILSHGGIITLDDSPKGGLRAIITLPI